MKAKIIIPEKEKVESKPKDFFRVNPKEVNYNNRDEALKEVFKNEGNGIITTGNKKFGLETISVNEHSKLIKTLECLYNQKIKPKAIVFDYNNKRVNAHAFLHELYIKQNLHIFRNLPIAVLNYDSDEPLVKDKIKVLAVNGSPRKNGDTKRILKEEVDKYWTGNYYESSFVDLGNIVECVACGGHQKNCKPDCVIDDQMNELLPQVKDSDVLLVGSPVYMDLPTSRTVAFISRLTGQTKHNRRAYVGKYAAALSAAWCSGTKAVISSLNNALEMTGFEIQGRSSKEYIALWNDGKTRGGVPHDFFWPE